MQYIRDYSPKATPRLFSWNLELLHWKKILSNFNLKSWVTGELKFNPGFRVIRKYLSQIDSILRVKSNWLWISSHFDSNILQLLGILGLIFVLPVTQILRSKWLHFFQSSTMYEARNCAEIGQCGGEEDMSHQMRDAAGKANKNSYFYTALKCEHKSVYTP